jgi:hypothetical protein
LSWCDYVWSLLFVCFFVYLVCSLLRFSYLYNNSVHQLWKFAVLNSSNSFLFILFLFLSWDTGLVMYCRGPQVSESLLIIPYSFSFHSLDWIFSIAVGWFHWFCLRNLMFAIEHT